MDHIHIPVYIWLDTRVGEQLARLSGRKHIPSKSYVTNQSIGSRSKSIFSTPLLVFIADPSQEMIDCSNIWEVPVSTKFL